MLPDIAMAAAESTRWVRPFLLTDAPSSPLLQQADLTTLGPFAGCSHQQDGGERTLAGRQLGAHLDAAELELELAVGPNAS
jgi:hypothetical protein